MWWIEDKYWSDFQIEFSQVWISDRVGKLLFKHLVRTWINLNFTLAMILDKKYDIKF